MAAKVLASASLVLAVLQCCGGEAQIPDDVVNLLQSQVEVKKGEAKAAMHAKELEDEADYASGALKASCSASGICNGAELPASFKFAPSAGNIAEVEVEVQKVKLPEMKQEAAQTSADDSAVADASSSEASRFITLGNVLQFLALLLVLDVWRRCPWKGKSSTSTTGQTSTKAPAACSAPTPSFLSAALAGDEDAFEAQISSCRSQLSCVDNWGCTVLHYAAKGGSALIVKRLLDLGAAVDALDAWDETPLHLAARAGRVEACEALLAGGASISSANAEECTPLIVAGRANHEAVCNLLIGRGAGVDGLPDEMVPELVTGLLAQQAS